MTVWFFTIVSAFCAVGMEYLYRTLPGSWVSHLWIWLPCALVVNYSIYRLVTMPGTPLIGALVMWSFATIISRTLISFFLLRDTIAPGVWCALVLMIAARITQSYWK
jgi:sulfite exporter TauE/SafE